MKLSKECIEAIENENPYNYEAAMDIFTTSVIAALTNPSIYSKAGLISLEEMFEFINWSNKNATQWLGQDNWEYDLDGKDYTTSQLFQIYKQQKL